MPTLLQLQKINGDGGWKQSVFLSFFWLTRRSWCGKKSFGASYSTSNKLLLVARLQASKNAFKVGSVKFANSLSLPSIVKQVRTGSKSSQGTWAMLGKSWGSQQPCLNCPIESTGKEENWTVPSIQVTRYISCLCEKLGNVVHLILNSSWRVQSLNELWIGIVYLQLKKNKKTCW